MKARFYCEAPDHEGDRIIHASYDQVVVSEDHMANHGKERRYRIHRTNLCRKCSDAREQKLRPRGPNPEPLFSLETS